MARSGPARDEPGGGDAAAPDLVARDMLLVRRAQRGDLDAYGELVRRHMQRAFSIAWSIVRNREDAEDVVQESFVRTLQRIDRIDASRPFHPWLFRVVVNRAISHQRARSPRVTDELSDAARSDEALPDQLVERRELRERLIEAVDSLPERQRTIVLLADVEEFNSAEIAQMLQMPAGTVRYHLHLARRTLRAMLSAADEEAR